MEQNSFRIRLLRAVSEAMRPAWRTAVWVIKMVVPITLAISILEHLGVIGRISEWIAPLFGLVGLPGDSGLVFLTAALSNNYAAVAVIATLGFDYRSVVILAVMTLVCHCLIIESAIQHKTGASGLKMTLLTGRLFLPPAGVSPETWAEAGLLWLKTILPLSLKIGIIIVSLNILQRILQEFRLLDLLTVPLQPLMAVFGLPRSTSFLWIISNVVGLTYGGAALVDEIRRGAISREDSRLLNAHVAISHSLLEDTAIFYSIGVGLFWLLVPRIILAICTVWIIRLFVRLRNPRRSIAPG